MSDAAGASKAYRNAVKDVANSLGVEPRHTGRPRKDFESLIDQLDDVLEFVDSMDQKSRERALIFYEMGLRRGINNATTAVAEGKFYFKNKALYCPDEFKVNVSIKFSGEKKREKFTFNFTPKDMGFE
jgi:hypothetical protein